MTCPFCGAGVVFSLDGVPESYECGSGDLRQSKICRELCQLRDKKAEGLAWEDGEDGSLVATLPYKCAVVFKKDSQICLVFQGMLLYRKFDCLDAAKAHAEELHQQAWRELRNKWDAK